MFEGKRERIMCGVFLIETEFGLVVRETTLLELYFLLELLVLNIATDDAREERRDRLHSEGVRSGVALALVVVHNKGRGTNAKLK